MAGPSLAVTPIASECVLERPELRMSEGWTFNEPQPDYALELARAGDGIAMWSIRVPNRWQRHVFQHCLTGEELIIDADEPAATPIGQWLEQFAWSDRQDTFSDLADEARTMGADVQRAKDTQGNCACLTLFRME